MSLRAVAIAVVALQATVIIATGAALSHQSKQVRAHKSCVEDVAAGHAGALSAAKVCAPAIVAVNQSALSAAACDRALSARPENAYGVGAYCSTPVKTVQAERDLARREAARLTTDLTNERLGRDAAIARAQVAATTQAERKARAAAAVQAAPRDGSGLIRCDAECVRQRWAGAGDERP